MGERYQRMAAVSQLTRNVRGSQRARTQRRMMRRAAASGGNGV